MTRDEILSRYRHLRAINTRHQTRALDFLARPAMLSSARRLGLAAGQHLIADSMEEMTLAFDLALYTGRDGRSRTIDRYAKTVGPGSSLDDMIVLDAMRRARFSVWRRERRHERAGVILLDTLRGNEVWLVDEDIETSMRDGWSFASRVFDADGFAMTCGVVVPIDGELLELAFERLVSPARDLECLADDPRFATAIYRAALEFGAMDEIAFREVAPAAG